MRYQSPRREFITSLVFDTDLTFGQLYRAIRAAKQEREAILDKEPIIDPVLFREVRDLGLLMEYTKNAFIQANAQFANGGKSPE
ncbi:hypothetical protein CLV58_101212 [Spirosoma oryzae]|uniref:Uncharacterized protein n=1 Tax=Spirosoma oryzae TaxID=1469603 RepID=A0A2T0TNA9_9BACT|nr:hypothetical protein CLV58_101212 [Spirosoma oryzae]